MVWPAVWRVPLNEYSMRASTGQLVALAGAGPDDLTLSGAASSRARNQPLKMWQPMSPRVAVPKSRRLRQMPG